MTERERERERDIKTEQQGYLTRQTMKFEIRGKLARTLWLDGCGNYFSLNKKKGSSRNKMITNNGVCTTKFRCLHVQIHCHPKI